MKKKFKKADYLFEQIIAAHPLNLLPISFYKFFATGFTAFLVDNTVLNLIIYLAFDGDDKRIFDTLSVAKFLSACAGIIVGFIINKVWTFRDAKHNDSKSQAVKYLMTFAVNLGIASILFPIYKDLLHRVSLGDHFDSLAPTGANVMTTATIMFISYFSYRFFVFRKD